MAFKIWRIPQYNGHYAVHGHWRSPLPVPNRKPVYDFLLVNNTYMLSRTFSNLIAIVDQIVDFDKGVPVFNTLVRVEPLNLQLRNLVSYN